MMARFFLCAFTWWDYVLEMSYELLTLSEVGPSSHAFSTDDWRRESTPHLPVDYDEASIGDGQPERTASHDEKQSWSLVLLVMSTSKYKLEILVSSPALLPADFSLEEPVNRHDLISGGHLPGYYINI